MAYDPEIEQRLQAILARWKGMTCKKMFGGVGHLLNGNMLAGVYKDFLILRLGPEAAQKALDRETVRPFDITGKPMKGWVMVTKDGFATDNALRDWLKQAKQFVSTLPSR